MQCTPWPPRFDVFLLYLAWETPPHAYTSGETLLILQDKVQRSPSLWRVSWPQCPWGSQKETDGTSNEWLKDVTQWSCYRAVARSREARRGWWRGPRLVSTRIRREKNSSQNLTRFLRGASRQKQWFLLEQSCPTNLQDDRKGALCSTLRCSNINRTCLEARRHEWPENAAHGQCLWEHRAGGKEGGCVQKVQ